MRQLACQLVLSGPPGALKSDFAERLSLFVSAAARQRCGGWRRNGLEQGWDKYPPRHTTIPSLLSFALFTEMTASSQPEGVLAYSALCAHAHAPLMHCRGLAKGWLLLKAMRRWLIILALICAGASTPRALSTPSSRSVTSDSCSSSLVCQA